MVSAYEYNYIFKVIVVGDMGTGKSALLRCFLEKDFRETAHTIGVEFGAKVVAHAGERIKLQIWDTAGQERFRSVTRSYYRGTAGVLLVYDIARRVTFDRLDQWLADIRKLTHPCTTTLLVGAKRDCDDDGGREVSYEEGATFARDHGLLFIETSAKTGDGVETGFMDLTTAIYDRARVGDLDPSAVESGVQRKGPTAVAAELGLTAPGALGAVNLGYPALSSVDGRGPPAADWRSRCGC
ncbi:Ras- protein Rab-14 [Tieghemiomyces parasiticus]|uniref:Ras- protein Rab-14 n=1 Tax=Tieghemiomyces parasiticus TaxID=78921 RepID=A0A9W8AB59_9FUNG|nr:Ras- protein Rab-14 [Tieghemiomyces parasiticus]